MSEREDMVQEQLVRRGIRDELVLDAMRAVPREEFVPPSMRDRAYADGALPIACEQTISQPYTVAFMIEAMLLEGGEKVLEIGTGSGYGAAVLSKIAGFVHTIERIPELAEEATERLRRLGYDNVNVHFGDGSLGLPSEAPFDAIVATAGAPRLPHSYEKQVVEGGRIVIPVGMSWSQELVRFTRKEGKMIPEYLGGFAFVPLLGREGWP